MLFKDMDKDYGCRYDLFKVVNIVFYRELIFFCLIIFYFKMVLFWYNKIINDWGKDKLGDRFIEFVGFLRDVF